MAFRRLFALASLALVTALALGARADEPGKKIAPDAQPVLDLYLTDSTELEGNTVTDGSFQPLGHFLEGPATGKYDLDSAARFRGGFSYLDDEVDDTPSGTYGLDMALRLAGQTSAYGAATYSHLSGGTQFFGTVGLFRQGDPCGGALDRTSGGILFDQLADTRFDDPIYVSQLRYFLGFALSEQWGAGVTYSDPVQGDNSRVAFGGFSSAGFTPAETVEAYLSTWWGPHQVTATLGSRFGPDETVAGLLLRHRLSKNVTASVNLNTVGGELWACVLGLEWQFGGGRYGAHGYASSDSQGKVVRAQGDSGLGNPYRDPSLGPNLNYGPELFSSRLSVSPQGGVTPLDQDSIGGQDPVVIDPDLVGDPIVEPEA